MEAWIYAIGFFVMMLLHELAIEGVMTNYPSLPSTVSVWVSLAQFCGCVAVPAVISVAGVGNAMAPTEAVLPTARKVSVASPIPKTINVWLQYIGLAALVFCATAVSNHALHWVQYPVKVVFKSSKLVPTMIVATVLGNTKKYSFREYVAALLICGGVAGFASGGGKDADKDLNHSQVLIGVGLLLISVIADAFVPNIQQRFLQGPAAVTVDELMMRTNVIGCQNKNSVFVTFFHHLTKCLLSRCSETLKLI